MLASRMWLWPRPSPWCPGTACPRPCHSPTWSHQRRRAAVCCAQTPRGVLGWDPPESKRTDTDREQPSTAWSNHTFSTNSCLSISASHLTAAHASPARPVLLKSTGQSFIWLSYLLISAGFAYFDLSIHQRILKNKNVSWFPQKYGAAQLFSTLIIIRNVSWAANQHINDDFWRIMWHWRLE